MDVSVGDDDSKLKRLLVRECSSNFCEGTVVGDIVVLYSADSEKCAKLEKLLSLLKGLTPKGRQSAALPLPLTGLPPGRSLSLTFKHCIVFGTRKLFSNHASVAFIDKLCECVWKQTAGMPSRVLPIYTNHEVSLTMLWRLLPRLACRVPLKWDSDSDSFSDILSGFLQRTAATLDVTRFTCCQFAAEDLSGFEWIWEDSLETVPMDSSWNLNMIEDAAQNRAYYIADASERSVVGCRVLSIDRVPLTNDLGCLAILRELNDSFSFEIQRPTQATSLLRQIALLRERVRDIRRPKTLQEEMKNLLDAVNRVEGKWIAPIDLPRLLTLASSVGIDAKDYKILRGFSVEYPSLFWKPFCDEFRYGGKERYVIKKRFEKNPTNGQVDVAFMPGTKLNVCENMLDFNIDKGLGEKLALRFCLNDKGREDYTFNDLRERVCQCAAYLSNQGIQYGTEKKDTVLLYLPKCSERVIYLLACFRIGVPVGILHPRTSSNQLTDKVEHSGCTVIVTGGDVECDITKHPPESHETKLKTKIILVGCLKKHQTVAPCFCDKSRRVETSLIDMTLTKFEAERPLFYLFTSGTAETSKTAEHAAFGYMVYTAVTYRFVLDFGITFDDGVINDVSFCTADLAWIDGMTSGLCGPLLCGGTAVMYEGSFEPCSEYTDAIMRIINECKVTHFCTLTAGIMDLKDCAHEEFFTKNTSLAVVTSATSRFASDLPEDVLEFLKSHNLRFANIWWQTETGSFMMGCPAKIALDTGQSQYTKRDLLPFYGIAVDVKEASEKEEDTKKVSEEEVASSAIASGSRTARKTGELCITQPWPSCVRRFLGDKSNQFSKKFDDQNSLAFKSGDRVEEFKDKILSYRVALQLKGRKIRNEILIKACQQGDENLIRLTVSKGCDVHATNKDGRTALYYAITNGHRKIAAYLIGECGANVNERYTDGVSALMQACQTGNLDVAAKLLSYECDVNATDAKGNSPLSIAVLKSNWSLAKLLISSGCKLDVKWGREMQTVLHRLAMQWYDDKCLQLAKEVIGRAPALADCRDLNEKVPFELGNGEMRNFLKSAWRECRYRKLFEKGRTKPSRVKVYLIGNGGAGKTTLMNSLRRKCGKMSPYLPTAGVDIVTAAIDSAGELVFFDFAGDPAFHKTHGLFFSETTTIFILVVDATMSEEELVEYTQYWLSFVKCSIKMTGKATVVLVGSRGDRDNGKKLNRINHLHLRTKFRRWFKMGKQFVLDCREQESAKLQKLREYIGSLKQNCIEHADEVPTIVEKVQSSLLPQIRDLLHLQRSKDALKEMAEKDMLPQALFKLINRSDGDPAKMSEVLKAPYNEDIYSEINSALQTFGLSTLLLTNIERHYIHVGLLKLLVEKNVYQGLKNEELDLLVAFLHNIGEIVAVKNQVVLDPSWLCQSLIGPLLSPDYFPVHLEGVVNGVVSKENVKAALDGSSKANQTCMIEVDEAIKMLCHLEICYQVKERPDAPAQYQFPALIQTVDRKTVWQRKENMVLYVGRRLQCEEKTDIITPGTMPFIQSRVAVTFHPTQPLVWKSGLMIPKMIKKSGISLSKCTIEGMIELHEKSIIDFVVRGPQDWQGECLTFLTELIKLGQTVLKEKSAGTDISLLYLSRTELQKLSVQPLAYAREAVEQAMRLGLTTAKVSQAEWGQDFTAESLKDLLAVPRDHYLLVSTQTRRAIADSLNKDTVDRRTAFAKELSRQTGRGSSYAHRRSAEDVLTSWSESLCSTVSRLEEAATKVDVEYVLALLENGGAIQLSDDTKTRAKDALMRMQAKRTAAKGSTASFSL